MTLRTDITVIVPTHNRHEKLRRLISYAENFDFPIIILDSSSDRLPLKVTPSLLYLHTPALKFAQKIVKGCEIANTKYVCMCADDDFFLPSSLTAACKMLVKSGGAGAVGSVLTFPEHFEGAFCWQFKGARDAFFTYSNASEYFMDYSQVLWGVYTEKSLRKCFLSLSKMNLLNDNFIELFLAATLIREGGVHRLKSVVSIRENSSSAHWGSRHVALADKRVSAADLEKDLMEIYAFTNRNDFDIWFEAYIDGRRVKKPLISRLLRAIRHRLLPPRIAQFEGEFKLDIKAVQQSLLN